MEINCSLFTFRAAHDGEYRKLKNETKKLLEVVGNVKKTAANSSSRQSLEITKLSDEIASLKDARNLMEKKARMCTCSGRATTAAAVPATKSDPKIEQITATAKAEIHKLVREEVSLR